MGTGLTLIIPTRNERENMPLLLPRIRESLGDLSYEVLMDFGCHAANLFWDARVRRPLP